MAQIITVRFGRLFHERERAGADAACARGGASITAFAAVEPLHKSYARINAPDLFDVRSVLAQFDVEQVWDGAFVAVEVTPSDPRVLGHLLRELLRGTPAGLVGVREYLGAVLLEVDDRITPITLIMELVDSELHRLGSGRRTRALLPLTDDAVMRTLAHHWNAPELDTRSILESYLDGTVT